MISRAFMVFFLLVSLSLVTFRTGRADSHDSGMPQTEISILCIDHSDKNAHSGEAVHGLPKF